VAFLTKNKVDFDKFADDYDELLDQQLNFFSEDIDYYARYKVNLVVDDFTEHNIEDPLHILEYGCGIGRNLIYFSERYPKANLTGYDISQKSISIAQKEFSNVFFTSDINELKSEHYDLIFVAGVFHHIVPELRSEVFDHFFQKLKKTGSIFVFEHNAYNPVTRKMVRECPFDQDAILIKSKEMKGLIEDAGFNISYVRYTLFFPPNLTKASQRLDKLFTWLPLGGQYYVKAVKQM
jgi:SAM-dependent methyltransferase